MKYEILTRRINWSEQRAGNSFLLFDTLLHYWFAIAFVDGREYQGEGQTQAKAHQRLCTALDMAGLTRIPLDKLPSCDKMSSVITSRVPIL